MKERLGGWRDFVKFFYAGRGESEPPMTKDEYKKQNSKNPPKPTAEDWRNAEASREAWQEIRRDYYLAAQSPYHYEEVFRYPDHLFEKPPEPEVKSAKQISEERREMLAGMRERLLQMSGRQSAEDAG